MDVPALIRQEDSTDPQAIEVLPGEAEEVERSIMRLRGVIRVRGEGAEEAMLIIWMIHRGMRQRGVTSMIFRRGRWEYVG